MADAETDYDANRPDEGYRVRDPDALDAEAQRQRQRAEKTAEAPNLKPPERTPEQEAELEARIADYEARKRAAQEPAPDATPKPRKGRKHRRSKRARSYDAAHTPEKPSPASPETALQKARSATEVLEAVARITWAEAHAGDPCPAQRIPSPAGLATWLAECTGEALDVADELLRRMAKLLHGWLSGWWIARGNQPDPDNGPHASIPTAEGLLISPLEAVHGRWLETLPSIPDLRHPVAPLVDSWQRLAPVPVKADCRPRAILSGSLQSARRVHADQLPLGLDSVTPLGAQPTAEQGWLPGLEPPPSAIVPVLPLALYDLAGGAMQSRGRGAPVAQRLFFELLMSVGRLDRVPGQTARIEVTYRDLVRWLWPNLRRRAWERRKHLPALYRALLELDSMRILWGRQLWRLVAVQALPTNATRPDDSSVFRVEHLPGSEHGPMIHRARLRGYGLVSAPAWRAFLRLAYLWDDAKRRNGGSRIYATRPTVARGLGDVILGVNGKPLRDRRGSPVTDWKDRRAVPLGVNGKPAGDGNPPVYERNPAADRVSMLGPDDLIRLAFDDDMDTNRRWRLHSARQALARMEADGAVAIERDCRGLRIIEAIPGELRANAG